MSVQTGSGRTETLTRVEELVRERVKAPENAMAAAFARAYYDRVADEDLLHWEPEDLYGAAMSHWNFLKRRTAHQTKIRTYNPRVEEHGWQSTHTIVEIVTDDMPFVIDSLGMAIKSLGLTVHLVVHPVVRVVRDSDGEIVSIVPRGEAADADAGAQAEAVTHVQVDRQTDEQSLEAVTRACAGALADVRAAVDGWRPMCDQLATVTQALKAGPICGVAEAERDEAIAFLEWMADNHFTFLGYRRYHLTEAAGGLELEVDAGSGLGILNQSDAGQRSTSFSALSAQARDVALAPRVLTVTKANTRATVHRQGYMDYVGVKIFDEAGKVVGEHRFLGLFTSGAYNRSPRFIPLLREKVRAVLDGAGYASDGHDGKALLNVLETFPRDMLFQVEVDELTQTALGIVHVQERQRVRLFVHRDPFQRYFNCLVYVPRERFNTRIRLEIEALLASEFGAVDTEFNVLLTDSTLARLHFVFRMSPGAQPQFDVAALQDAVSEATRAWSDRLFDAALERFGEEHGTRLMKAYGQAFRADYREQYSARMAVSDIEHMEGLSVEGTSLALSLYRPLESGPDELRFKLFLSGRAFPLSQALPMLENMGVTVQDEHPSKIKRSDGARIWMHDFGLRFEGASELDLGAIREKFHQTFDRVWRDEAENDGFNRLVLRARLSWRDIVILRACCKYLRQATIAFSQTYMERALFANPRIAALLVELFHARLNPGLEGDRGEIADSLVEEILEALDEVVNLDEDRILRSYLGLIQAILRTNFYQSNDAGDAKSYLSFKLDPQGVAELPEPRPMYEIFVYSPQVEGVHLRGGPVARGGLRWSDRPEDFRTEVLGLVKAQMVKNAVIVPVGSKGGFYAKRLPSPADREAFLEGGKAAYRTFIRGLLDVTDNLVAGELTPPHEVVRHDGDDPYLVVAADKGTATFSDIANEIAIEYGYWLGDAFASGGSQGYDHKGMGITAKGAWESVKRHFREMGTDTQSEPFTVVGVGDMSGDVFGNGMLLSEHIKLIAAFNHLHIFIDPDPDPALGFAERSRMFALPRSTWDDYDRDKISAGGGVYPRSAKSIRLSAAAKEALGADREEYTPNELIQTILKAPVDLLWNGGIGTYVKASSEHNDEVGDRANDAVRISGCDLRCRVVGEGGNLGFTQRGRIEYASAGGRIFTDAIDNSAGVDCSDHEVNIKVLLNEVVAGGDMTEKQRNQLLADMTDEVGELVLRDNYLQTQALSVAQSQAGALLEVHERLIKDMERTGELDPAIEFLPDAEEFAERAHAGRGLTAPELSVLLAYVKIELFKELLQSHLADDPFMAGELVGYFPTQLRNAYRPQIETHRLRNEIICTMVANELVNRAGITGLFRLASETGARPSHIAVAYLAAREIFDVEWVWTQIEALDNKVPAAVQNRLLLETRKLVERTCRWLLRNRSQPMDVASTVAQFSAGIERLWESLPQLVGEAERERIEEMARSLEADQVPAALAARIACFEDLISGLDLVKVTAQNSHPIAAAARVYFALGERLDFAWFREQVAALPRDNRWQTLARAALRDDLYGQQSLLTADVMQFGGSLTEAGDDFDAGALVDDWLETRGRVVERCQQIVGDLRAHGNPDFTMLSVAMRELRAMQVPLTPKLTSAGDAASPDAGGATDAGGDGRAEVA